MVERLPGMHKASDLIPSTSRIHTIMRMMKIWSYLYKSVIQLLEGRSCCLSTRNPAWSPQECGPGFQHLICCQPSSLDSAPLSHGFTVVDYFTVCNVAGVRSSECLAVWMQLLFLFIIQDTEMSPDLEGRQKQCDEGQLLLGTSRISIMISTWQVFGCHYSRTISGTPRPAGSLSDLSYPAFTNNTERVQT